MFLGAFIFLLSFAWMCVHPVGGRRRSESRPRLVPSPSSFLCASALSHSRRAVRIRQLPCIIVPRKSSLPFSVGNSHVGSRTFDPLFRLDDPKLGYTVLDLIFIFGRLAASGPREESSGSICSESVWRQRHGDTGTGKKEKGTRGRGEPPWVRLFERHRVLTPVTFREALQRLPFKWPESARFPAYNLYAYEEKFYNFSSPDPEVCRILNFVPLIH
uniref:Uncharacterized protein n=1 Tax=Chromera velia CCMP2878 TaxID=1169474 RepID=A0A0K6S8Q4_9ALVE|eukprot:Cvel_26633.t2-p1 / transcript=Cvel_26633.t2 / gene=Cvel_26633 / organism=Chromera_velia_CCMP2878 / gene_product=hypothetical protein / transcript_product=hypothetical protein / location=Cvel_scaffold3200:4849-5493(+) / protein_length=215 / sequence_SO=supercontig / SO=protein_coding / is_pseudo=false